MQLLLSHKLNFYVTAVPSHAAKRKAGYFLCSSELMSTAPCKLFAKIRLFIYCFLLGRNVSIYSGPKRASHSL